MVKRKTFSIIGRSCNYIFTAPVFVLIAWELLSRLNVISSIYFPPPSAIFLRLIHLIFNNPQFVSDIFFSVKRLLLGAMIAVPSAIILGLAMGLNRKISAFVSPLISVTYPIPKLSILPFLMIIFGIGDASKVAIIAMGVFYFVLLSIIHGIKGLPQVYFDIIFIYKIPLIKRIYSVILKGVLPDILNGCKIGLGYGLVMVVAGEFIAAKNGIGFFMWNAWDQFRINDLYVGLVIFSLMGLMIFALFDFFISRLRCICYHRFH